MYGALTGIDSYDCANSITDFAISKGYCVLYECAPSEKQGLLGVDLKRLEDMGYDTRFKILAVGDLISSMAIHKRYEQELIKKPNSTTTKLTDLSRHDDSYKGVDRAINESIMTDRTEVYIRGTEQQQFLPQLILPNFKIENTDDILKFVNAERNRTNSEYAKDGFSEDYAMVMYSMQSRKAPTEQFDQINEIFRRYSASHSSEER